MDEWVKILRRAEDALARFYVAHKKTGCSGDGCALCHEFTEGVHGGLNIYLPAETKGGPLVHLEPSWMKILQDAGCWETVETPK
jgi:hypothetical protein